MIRQRQGKNWAGLIFNPDGMPFVELSKDQRQSIAWGMGVPVAYMAWTLVVYLGYGKRDKINDKWYKFHANFFSDWEKRVTEVKKLCEGTDYFDENEGKQVLSDYMEGTKKAGQWEKLLMLWFLYHSQSTHDNPTPWLEMTDSLYSQCKKCGLLYAKFHCG